MLLSPYQLLMIKKSTWRHKIELAYVKHLIGGGKGPLGKFETFSHKVYFCSSLNVESPKFYGELTCAEINRLTVDELKEKIFSGTSTG